MTLRLCPLLLLLHVCNDLKQNDFICDETEESNLKTDLQVTQLFNSVA